MTKRLSTFLICFSLFIQLQAQNTFQKVFGGDDDVIIQSVKSTKDGGYVLAGSIDVMQPTARFTGTDVIIIKTNSKGDTLWSKIYGTDENDEAYEIIPLTDGGYIVTGYTTDSASGSPDLMGIRLNASGNVMWFKHYGGDRDELGFSVCPADDGGFVFSGMTETFTSGYNAAYVVKTKANGELEWSKSFEDDDDEDWILSSAKTKDGGFVFTGYTYSYGPGRSGVYIIKIKQSGEVEWRKSYGGSDHIAEGYSIKETTDGGFVVVGSIQKLGLGDGRGNDLYVIRLKPDGDTLWTKRYGGSFQDYGESIDITADGGYIVCGYTDTFGAGQEDIYVIKLNTMGDTLWTRTFGDEGTDEAYSIAQASDGGLILAGIWDSSNGFLIKLDKDGNSGCLGNNTGTTYSGFPTLKSDVTSMIINATTEEKIQKYFTDKGKGGQNICSTDIGIQDAEAFDQIQVYPNPGQGILHVVSDKIYEEVRLVDLLGKTVFNSTFSATKTQINIEKSGIYFLIIKKENKTLTRKIIVN